MISRPTSGDLVERQVKYLIDFYGKMKNYPRKNVGVNDHIDNHHPIYHENYNLRHLDRNVHDNYLHYLVEQKKDLLKQNCQLDSNILESISAKNSFLA